MLATVNDRSVPSAERTNPVAQPDDLLRQIEVTPQVENATGDRHARAKALVAMARSQREPIDELRTRFARRLDRATDDYGAIEGLRVVEAALPLIPRPAGLWVWQQRERQGKRRWWKGRARRLRGARGSRSEAE